MPKKKEKTAFGITVIAAFEAFFGLAAICMLVSAVLDILKLPVPSGLATEIVIDRVRASGISHLPLLVWSLIYFAVFAVSVGMFVRKEWARRLTLIILPIAIAMLFPFFFPDYSITAEKMRILFQLSRVTNTGKEFFSSFLEVISSWWAFVIFFIGLWVILQKYLSDKKIRDFFS
jgi:uncharacterized membrane protein YwzB